MSNRCRVNAATIPPGVLKAMSSEDRARYGLTIPGEPSSVPAKTTRKARVGKGAQTPNANEQRWLTLLRATAEDVRYQALTFHMKNGHDYTPDAVAFDEDGRPFMAWEFKGAYRLGSHQRARLAFDQARVEFPGIRWKWHE